MQSAQRKTGLLKIGKCCIEVPMLSETVYRRAGHGRVGEPLRELAKLLAEADGQSPAILLGAGYGERLADIRCAAAGGVLCVEASPEGFELLERNAPPLGGTAVRARIGATLDFTGLLARFPQYRMARLFVCEGSEDTPVAVASALEWIGAAHPILVLEAKLRESDSLERWRELLAALAVIGYQAGLVLDPQEHLLGWLRDGEELLAALASARQYGGGLGSATLYLSTSADLPVLQRARATLRTGVDSCAAHRIAVVRLDNLGDHVLGSGIFAALRVRYPRSKLVAFVPASVAELYTRCPTVDALVALPPPAQYLRSQPLWDELNQCLACYPKFDLVLNPRFAQDFYGAGAICSALAAPTARVLGFRQCESPIPNYDPNSRYRELLDAPPTLHVAQYTDLIAQAANRARVPTRPQAWFEPQDWSSVAEHLQLEPRRYIAVGIGASLPLKTPALDTYRHTLARLLAERDRVILIGSADESPKAEALLAMFPATRQLISAAGLLRLPELAALLAHARLYVGPDAGPKHIAAAAGTPVLELAWVPADHPATSRGELTGGACWRAWDTPTRTVHPSREAYELAIRTGALQTPIGGFELAHLDRAIEELLGVQVTALQPQPAALLAP